MKQTILYQHHLALKAKMLDFAGYEMPLSYKSAKTEHLSIRKHCGMFDVSHMGEFLIEGDEAVDLVQYVTSNNAKKLQPGQVQYSCLPTEKGGIVDDLLVYCLNPKLYLLVVNAANIVKDFDWINKHNKFKATVNNVSDEWSLIAIQGPETENILQKQTNTKLSEIRYYGFTTGNIGVANDVIISATGYTGERGFELYLKNQFAIQVWEMLLKENVVPCGLAARDTLRLEMGYALYGNDIDNNTSALQAGLAWITKLNIEDDFIGKNFLKTEKTAGISQKLIGFKMVDKGIPRQGYEILNKASEKIGKVTSGTQSPVLNEGIGLAYISDFNIKAGDQIFINIRNKPVEAVIEKLPFIKETSLK